MCVLVLGGTQFVGRHVVQALLDTLMAARHVVSCYWLVRRLAYPAWRALGADGKTLVVQGPTGEQSIDLGDRTTPIHVFRKGSRLVVYFGNDQSVLELLTDMLGPQLAGQ